MKTHKKILVTLVFAVTTLFTAMAAIFAEKYVIGEEYYKDFPGSGYKQAKVDSIAEYDGWGNKIYEKKSDGRENWYKYDEQGNLIYEKKSNGYELWYEYNENGNLVYMSDSDGEKNPLTIIEREICFIRKIPMEMNGGMNMMKKEISFIRKILMMDLNRGRNTMNGDI